MCHVLCHRNDAVLLTVVCIDCVLENRAAWSSRYIINLVPTEKLTSELQSRETKCMMLYQRLQRWPECNALAHKLLLKK